MPVKKLLVLALILIQSLIASQEIEELESQLQNADQSTRIRLLIQLADEYKKDSREAALAPSYEAIRGARALGDQQLYSDALFAFGHLFYLWGQLDSATAYLNNSMNIRTALGDSSGVGKCLNRLGHIAWFKNDQITARHDFDRALAIHTALGEKREIGKGLTNIANLHRQWGNYREALELYLEALEYYKADDYSEGIAWLYFSTSILYKQLGDYEKSLVDVHRSLDIYQDMATATRDSGGVTICYGQLGDLYRLTGDFQKGLEYHFKALHLREKSGVASAISTGLSGIGQIYYEMNDDSTALDYLTRSLEKHKKTKDTTGKATVLKYIGFVYQRMGDNTKALDYLLQGLKLAQSRKERTNEQDILEHISEIYNQKREYKTALDIHKQFTAVKDSIFNYEISNRIASIQIQNEIEERQKENQRLAQNVRIAELELTRGKNQRNFLAILSITGFLVVIAVGLLYRNKIKDNRLLARTSDEILKAHQDLKQEIEERKQLEKEHEELIGKQKEALDKIRTLSGLIPICANCKKIRNDEGYYEHLEKFIMDHSDAVFSHGICPDCMKKLYPNFKPSKKEAGPQETTLSKPQK